MLLVAAGGLPSRTQTVSTPGFGERLVVGALIQNHEVGSLDVRRDADGYLLPLYDLADLIGCSVEVREGVTSIITPLGSRTFAPGELTEADGIVYVHETWLEGALASGVEFDGSRYALAFDLPWRPGTGRVARRAPPDLEPDATPPGFSLSTLRSDLRYTRLNDDDLAGSTWDLAGRLGPGHWRVRYENDLNGQHVLRDYAWFHRQDNWLLLAGNQRVRLHPLFNGLELTGAQAAWTNQPAERVARGATPGVLLPRRLAPVNDFVGFGPPAGIAVLRVDGSVIDRRRIAIDGRYEFLDVSIPARQASRIEVLLYDRRNPDVPIEIIEETRTASAYLLPDGALVHVGGAGTEGNAIQNEMLSQEGLGATGFYQTRYGHTDRVTFEGAIQHTGTRTQVMGGVVSRLSPAVVMSVGLASSDGYPGYSFDLEGLRPPWRVFVRSLATEAGFHPATDWDRYDHYLEWGYSKSRTLDIALIGRSLRQTTQEVDYVLPAFAWRPRGVVSLRAWPDIDGNYRFDLNYRVRPRANLSLSVVEDRGFADFYYQTNRSYLLRVAAAFGGELPDTQEAVVSWYGRGRWSPTWEA
ncbi:MAG: hypothetical protein R3344_11150, partial [Acidobacteriota bacterium]|nr:hypothetical protein [Acidobacteriota bacterium]